MSEKTWTTYNVSSEEYETDHGDRAHFSLGDKQLNLCEGIELHRNVRLQLHTVIIVIYFKINFTFVKASNCIEM